MLGFLIGLALILIFCIVYTDRTAERVIARLCHAESQPLSSLFRALEAGTSRLKRRSEDILPLPRIFIFPDPLPQVWVIRRMGGRGRILASQGLVATLTEEELRAVFRCSYLRMRRWDVPWRTSCAAWNARMVDFLRGRSWTPLMALVGWALYPMMRFVGGQARKLDPFHQDSDSEQADEAWVNATQKVTRLQLLHGKSGVLAPVTL